MGVIRYHSLAITPGMLGGGSGIGTADVEVPNLGTTSRVLSVAVVIPALSGATTGDSLLSLSYLVHNDEGVPGISQQWEVTGTDAPGGPVNYNPVLHGQVSNNSTVSGDYKVSFSKDAPLIVRYSNTTDVALSGEVSVLVFVEHV